MRDFFAVFFFAGLIAGMVIVVLIGTGRQEAVECWQWQEDANKYPGYYITNWQKEQCDAHHITINAPVR